MWNFSYGYGIHYRLSRSNTARGSCTGLLTVGSTRNKASKSVLFTNDPSKYRPILTVTTVWNWNTGETGEMYGIIFNLKGTFSE